jgi:lysophospholipase L1-like esterase
LLNLKPDLAVFTFYTGNDYMEILDKSIFHLEFREGKFFPSPPQKTIKDFLLNHSLIFKLIRRLNTNPYLKAERVKRFALWQSLGQEYFFHQKPKDYETATKMHDYIISQIRSTSARNGVNILFILLPTKYQVERHSDLDNFEKIEDILNLDPNEKLDDKIRTDVKQILKRADIPLLDPYNDFVQFNTKSNSNSQPLFWNTDHHLSEMGHIILGTELAAYLEAIFDTHKN